jgi:hypothetical protein
MVATWLAGLCLRSHSSIFSQASRMRFLCLQSNASQKDGALHHWFGNGDIAVIDHLVYHSWISAVWLALLLSDQGMLSSVHVFVVCRSCSTCS